MDIDSYIEGLTDPQDKEFFRKFASSFGHSGSSCLYSVLFGDPTELSAALRQYRLKFFNQKSFRQKLLAQQDLHPNLSNLEIARQLEQKALAAGLI